MNERSLLREALELPRDERASIAVELLDSLERQVETGAAEVELAWAREIERRARGVLSDDSSGVSWEEARDEALGASRNR